MTSQDLELAHYIDARLSEQTREIKTYVDEKINEVKIYVDTKIDKLDQRVTMLEKKADETQALIVQLDKSLAGLTGEVRGIDRQMNTYQNVIYWGFAFAALISAWAGFFRKPESTERRHSLTREEISEISALIDSKLASLK